MSFTIVMGDAALNELDASVTAAKASPLDEETFRAFYDRTARMTWAYLWRLTGDRNLADDLLQEAYYRFFKLGNVHDSEAHRRNSLFLIATNLVRDLGRRRKLVRMVPLAEDHDEEQIVPVIDGVGERAEARTDLTRAMAELKPMQREILWLAYALGSSHAEIADIVGIKAKSVKTLLFRARKKMAELLRGQR